MLVNPEANYYFCVVKCRDCISERDTSDFKITLTAGGGD